MKKTSLTTQYVLYFGLVLFFANIVLAVVLMIHSTYSLQKVIRKNMLDISTSAANLVDGDLFNSITEQTVGGDAFNQIYDQLSVFQQNADIQYIYSVRKIDEETFIFVVDADPVAPADYGEHVVVSTALKAAANGTPEIDNATVSDRWGTFYTAYSPIRNEAGDIVGVIGVDIDAAWYDAETRSHSISILTISALFTIAGIAVVLLINQRVKKRFSVLEKEIAHLSKDVDSLTGELQSNSDYKKIRAQMLLEIQDSAKQTADDEISSLSAKVRTLHVEMSRYLDYAAEQINTDALTTVGSVTAYRERCSKWNEEMLGVDASFAVLLFDINKLKAVNDNYGHDTGDRYIRAAAQAIAKVFGIGNTFRIGGDEFLVCTTETNGLDNKIISVNKELDTFNENTQAIEIPLSVSAGSAVYDAEKDDSVRATVIRADAQMYTHKNSSRF